jgi:hypothetical protein
MNDSDSDAAVQGGSPEVVVVPEVVEVVEVVAGAVVVVVGSVVAVAVLTEGEPVAAAPVEAAGVPPELPQAASAVTPIAAMPSTSVRFIRRGSCIAISGPSWVGGHPFLRTPDMRASIRDAHMDRSEELRQMKRPPRSGRIGAIERWLPFWEPQLVVACAIALQLSLSDQVTIGPTWLLPSLEGALLIGLVIVSPHPNVRHSPLRRHVAIAMVGLVSAANMVSLILLCHYLLHGTAKANGHELILSGIVLWVTNVLLFGLWYWEVDRGGPVARACGQYDHPDFLFPQMTDPKWAPDDWRPRLIDYLYVSLTNATAFSPTDTMPLTPTAKWLMSGQALASLVTVGLVVARAVNILPGS